MYNKFKRLPCIKLVCIALLYSFVLSAYAQSPIVVETIDSYHRSALRSLKRAKDYISNGNWNSAYSQAEIGLIYDQGLADLYYIQALSLLTQNASPAIMIPLLTTSLENTWYDYNRDAARLLLAQMYIETTNSAKALELLDQSPLLVSPDALLLRAQAYYTLNNSTEARLFVENGAKQYPDDSRFDLLFFKHEYVRQLEQQFTTTQIEDEFPLSENILTETIVTDAELDRLAVFFTSRAEKLSRDNPNVLLFSAIFYPYEEDKIRSLQAWNALGLKNPWYAVYALEAEIISEAAAFRYMLAFFSDIDYYCLKAFVSLVKDSSVKEKLRTYFATYEGSINFDLNADLIPDMTSFYNRGRPSRIEYDENQDGSLSWTIDCDYGVPIKITIPDENLSAIYGIWPSLARVSDISGDKSTYNLVANTLYWSPIQIIRDPVLEIQGETVLYIPVLDPTTPPFPYNQLFDSAFTIDVKTSEYDDSRVRYTVLYGIVKNAVYTENGTPYAYGHFENGKLQFRNIDRDKNGSYELVELYKYDPQNSYLFYSDSEKLIFDTKIFGIPQIAQGIYLYKVIADVDDDGISEFTEEYLPNGGSIVSWDTNTDGNWDTQFIQTSDPEKQKILYSHPISKKTISIQIENGIPIFANKQAIIQDPTVDFYWIGDYPGESYAEKIIAELNLIDGSGVILIISDLFFNELQDRFIRILGVKNGDTYFGEVFYE